MITHYVLVDFENIQPEAEDLSFLNDERIKIIIFVNAYQKLSLDRNKALRAFGDRVKYIEMSGSGKNALDFMIAFYLGDIFHGNPDAKAYVVSNDTGFDPLLKHIADNRPGSVRRTADLSRIKKNVVALANSSKVTIKSGRMRQLATCICTAFTDGSLFSLPQPLTALEDFIKAAFNGCDFHEQQMNEVLEFMIQNELISIAPDEGITYRWPEITAGAKGEFISKEPDNNAPQKPAALTPPTKELTKKACDDLKKRGNSKPRTLKTLASTIKAIFKGELSDHQIDAILDFMKSKKIIAVANGTKVIYNLEKLNT